MLHSLTCQLVFLTDHDIEWDLECKLYLYIL